MSRFSSIRVIPRKTNCWLHWDYRDPTSRVGLPRVIGGSLGTFARASVKRAVDSNGRVYIVGSGQPAFHHRYNAGVWDLVGVLLEFSRTNLCLQSENFGTTWTLQNTPTRVAQAARCGVVYLDLIGDDSGAVVDGYYQPITFTGDAVKAISFYVREGSSTSTQFLLNDAIAAANRLAGVITWSAGAPVVTMATGTHFGSERLQDADGNRVTRLLFQTTSVTAANTNNLIFYPAQTAAGDVTLQGTVYAGGVQAEDAIVPSSYIPTTTLTVTRNADVFSLPFVKVPAACTIYMKLVDLGTQALGSGANYGSVGTDGNNPSVKIAPSSTTNVRATHTVGSSVSSSAQAGAAYGDTVEFRLILTSTGTVQLGISKNGAAETTDTASSALALSASNWFDSVVRFATEGICALQTVKVVGGARTLAQMQAAV